MSNGARFKVCWFSPNLYHVGFLIFQIEIDDLTFWGLIECGENSILNFNILQNLMDMVPIRLQIRLRWFKIWDVGTSWADVFSLKFHGCKIIFDFERTIELNVESNWVIKVLINFSTDRLSHSSTLKSKKVKSHNWFVMPTSLWSLLWRKSSWWRV